MIRKIAVCTLLFVAMTTMALAKSVSFSWLPNTESDLAGYKIYYGDSSGNYTGSVDVGLPATGEDGRVHYTLDNIPDGIQYYAATAYDTNGGESEYSNELNYDPAPGACQDFKLDITVNVNVNTN